MTENQQIASNPEYSVWVSASAGTGKTKVLIDRVLRLLIGGIQPEKILCITFTKAAASEMQNRINEKLSEWVIATDEELYGQVKKLIKQKPDNETLTKARTLFAEVLEAPEGVRIQTIHAFCETILKKFPIEAGVSPHFQIIDSPTANEMIDDIIIRLIDETNPILQEAIKSLSLKFNANSFKDTLKDIISSRGKFKKYNILELKAKVKNALNPPMNTTKEDIINNFFNDMEVGQMEYLADRLQEGTANEIKRAGYILEGIEKKNIDIYKRGFLTQKNEPYKNFLTKKIREKYPTASEYAEEEQTRIIDIVEEIKTLDIYNITIDLLTVAGFFIDLYENEKSAKGFLDYADLIIKTSTLLKQSAMAQWVLYKLDGGLEHVLLDEAQDTSPEQWEVVTSLIEDWFSGASYTDKNRTVFVVGDKKQSIYSFQGADPDIFLDKKQMLETAVKQSGKIWKDVPLDISFRSTEAVLELVDKVFNADLTGISDEEIKHDFNRVGEIGKVEVWEVEID